MESGVAAALRFLYTVLCSGGEKKVVFLLHDIVLCEKTFIVIERPCEKTIGLQRKIIIYKMYYV